jgi:hypothetical protein
MTGARVTTRETIAGSGARNVTVEIVGRDRDEVAKAAARWLREHWSHDATISDPRQDGDDWRVTGSRWGRQ